MVGKKRQKSGADNTKETASQPVPKPEETKEISMPVQLKSKNSESSDKLRNKMRDFFVRLSNEEFENPSITPYEELQMHSQYLNMDIIKGIQSNAIETECKTTPLFSGPVLMSTTDSTFTQYGLLAGMQPDADRFDDKCLKDVDKTENQPDSRVLLNVSPPWSAFICGSQGSGKSHTLSCILENCLHRSAPGKLKHPLTGMVFHFDPFSSFGSTQICEAAYLASAGIAVKVLVSPTNYFAMSQTYEHLPGIRAENQPVVYPLKFAETQLDVARMMKLMAVTYKDGPIPLYMEVILRILREIALERQGAPGIDYIDFRRRLEREPFLPGQNVPMKLRLDLLESFMLTSRGGQAPSPADFQTLSQAWTFFPGCLTIVDLSCPFIDSQAACSLFNICLELFLSDRSSIGRVVALDEAHKFLNQSLAAATFTESLLQVIRQQRHLATRIIIATQEPTLSPDFIDLASMTIVHRFTSPAWFKTLKSHLAGAAYVPDSQMEISQDNGEHGNHGNSDDIPHLFQQIVTLNTGEALLFCPSAFLRVAKGEPRKLGLQNVKIRIRARISADGGKSIMAT